MKTILIPIDFQSASVTAINYARALYQKENVHIELLHVMPELNENLQLQAYNQFKTLQETVLKDWHAHVRLSITGGKIIEKIQEAIKQIKPQLVLIGLSGKAMVKELLKLTDAPLLIIPKGNNKTNIENIVYANDFKEIQVGNVLEPLRDVAQNSKAKVDVLHIEKEYKPKVDEAEESLEYYLELVNHEYVFIKSDDFPSAIQDYVHKNKIDLLTLLLRDHGQNENNSKGKLVARLLEETDVPILSLV
ncbi:MAG: universal stress protein [Cyclobacteriaceae bacterium]|nr:universal stress protein [Cyclobacteriaceae bacterium]